jgi:hypothetical protein
MWVPRSIAQPGRHPALSPNHVGTQHHSSEQGMDCWFKEKIWVTSCHWWNFVEGWTSILLRPQVWLTTLNERQGRTLTSSLFCVLFGTQRYPVICQHYLCQITLEQKRGVYKYLSVFGKFVIQLTAVHNCLYCIARSGDITTNCAPSSHEGLADGQPKHYLYKPAQTQSHFPARIENLEIDPFTHHVLHPWQGETITNHTYQIQTCDS